MSIVIDGFHKNYDGTVAVAGLTFSVEPGEILGLVGPNGAGKTTTLRALAGILEPSRGRLVVDGHDLRSQPVAAKSALAYVPDDPKLFDQLTVWEHLQFVASAYRLEDWWPLGEATLEQFDLVQRRDSLCAELSRGMRQKVAICCAYVREPRALLLDEPLTGLDPRAIRTMKDSIRQRAAEGTAIIVSSHLLSLVEDLCTRVLILHRGRQLLHESLESLRQQINADGRQETLEELFLRLTEAPHPATETAES